MPDMIRRINRWWERLCRRIEQSIARREHLAWRFCVMVPYTAFRFHADGSTSVCHGEIRAFWYSEIVTIR